MSDNKTPSGTIRFHQWCMPPLPVDDYEVVLEQNVKQLGGERIPAGKFSFSVAGPRFALNPAEIYCVYPPESSSGDFANSLPHIVFTRRTIPWERNLRPGFLPAFNAPWMALLLLSEEDFEDNKFPRIEPRTVADLCDRKQQEKDEVAGPKISDLGEYELKDPCNTIDLDARLFQEIAPREADLQYLAHVREVNTDDKETLSFLADGWFSVVIGNRFPQPAQPASKGVDLNSATLDQLKKELGRIGAAYAEKVIAARAYLSKEDLERKEIVEGVDLNKATPDQLKRALGKIGEVYAEKIIAARPYLSRMDLEHREILPAPVFKEVSPSVTVRQAVENRALLVSLEGMADYLRGPSVPFPKVRLAVLASWTFRCAEGIEFVPSMMRLDTGPIEIPFHPEKEDPQHAHPQESYVRGAFRRGYAALNHNTRRGEKTVSWYRGPLTPVTIERLAGYNFAAAPDAEVRYDPKKGMMDLTYAAAAQLGRLLGLQDRSFAQALCAWRTRVEEQLSALLDRENLQRALNSGRASLPGPESEFLQNVLTDAIKASPGKVARVATTFEDQFEGHLERPEEGDPDLNPPASVCQWLARRLLLYGVPFSYLVPDERMLPPDSMRFFSLDPGWVKCLLEGACSVGRGSTREQAVDEKLRNRFFDLAEAASPTIRQRPPADEAPAIAGIVTVPAHPVSGKPFTIMLTGKNFGTSGSTVSFTGPASHSASAKGSHGVDLNSASLEQLKEALGKIGEAYAQKIIDARPYQFTIDLERRGIVSAEIFKKVAKLVTVLTEVSPETQVTLSVAGSFMVTLKNDATGLTSNGFPLSVRDAVSRKTSTKSLKSPLEGFLLRSPLVRGWQGLEMKAIGLEDEPLTPLRIDRLSPEIMLCIFSGRLKSIEVRQPPEGMHFGATMHGGFLEKGILRSVIKMKDSNGKAKEPGDQIELKHSPVVVPVSSRRVVEVDKLAGSLHEHLTKPNGGMVPRSPLASFTSAEFGVQMTESPGRVTIEMGKDRR